MTGEISMATRARPFQLSADSQYFVGTGPHRRALGRILQGFEAGEVGAALIAPRGLGKTMLIKQLALMMEHRQAAVTMIAVPPGRGSGIMAILARSLGLSGDHEVEHRTKIEQYFLNQAAEGRRFALLAIDDAHRLNPRAIRKLHTMARQIRETGLSFAVVLGGRARLAQTIAQNPLDVQHGFRTVRLSNLGNVEQKRYIDMRLILAGWQAGPRFDREFYRAVDSIAHGVPRTINYVMGRVLSEAAIDGRDKISGTHVVAAARELTAIRRQVRGLTRCGHAPRRLL